MIEVLFRRRIVSSRGCFPEGCFIPLGFISKVLLVFHSAPFGTVPYVVKLFHLLVSFYFISAHLVFSSLRLRNRGRAGGIHLLFN